LGGGYYDSSTGRWEDNGSSREIKHNISSFVIPNILDTLLQLKMALLHKYF